MKWAGESHDSGRLWVRNCWQCGRGGARLLVASHVNAVPIEGRLHQIGLAALGEGLRGPVPQRLHAGEHLEGIREAAFAIEPEPFREALPALLEALGFLAG